MKEYSVTIQDAENIAERIRIEGQRLWDDEWANRVIYKGLFINPEISPSYSFETINNKSDALLHDLHIIEHAIHVAMCNDIVIKSNDNEITADEINIHMQSLNRELERLKRLMNIPQQQVVVNSNNSSYYVCNRYSIDKIRERYDKLVKDLQYDKICLSHFKLNHIIHFTLDDSCNFDF